MAGGNLLGDEAVDQIAKQIREERARYGNPEGHRGRWQGGRSQPCSGGGWYFSAEGAPAGGTSEWDVTVNGVTETITFPCPCSLAQTIAALETHSEINPGDVTGGGGTLPQASQKISFGSTVEVELLLNSLTRSWTAPPNYYWDPC